MVFSLRSQVALFTVVFVSCVSFAIVMPSMWPYLQKLNSTKSFLALVVATYSVGEGVGALLFGNLSYRFTTRQTMLVATVVGTIGSLLYVIAQLFPLYAGQYLVLLGRLAQGMWTGGAQALQPGYLAAVLPNEHLTTAIVTLNAYACLGFVVGPVFGLMFGVLPPVQLIFGLGMDQLTSPGYFVLASGLVSVVLYGFVFDEEGDRGSAPLDSFVRPADVSALPTETDSLLGQEKFDKSKSYNVASAIEFSLPLILCNCIFFVHFYGFALQETITTPLVQTYYNWTVMSANLLFTAAGLCALVTFFGLRILTRYFTDRALTAFSLVLGVIGYFLLMSRPATSLPVWRFLTGFAFISVAFPVGRTAVVSLYTKFLPLKMQGSGQGVILAVGAAARVLGPFWAVRALLWESGGLVVFGGTALLFGGCLVAMSMVYPQLLT